MHVIVAFVQIVKRAFRLYYVTVVAGSRL